MAPRTLLLCLLCLLPACHLANTDDTSANELGTFHLRILTFNINDAKGLDGKTDYQRLATIIKREQPDLVPLQDVSLNKIRGAEVNQAERLAELTDMHVMFSNANKNDPANSYNNAILSKTPFHHGGSFPVGDKVGNQTHSVTVSDTYPWPQLQYPVQIASIGFEERSDGTEDDFIYWIHQHYGVLNYIYFPNILAGTFQFQPGDPAYKRMIEDKGWVDSAVAAGNPEPTFPADKPVLRCDYVFYRHADYLRAVEVRVIDEPAASNHRPLLVVLEYRPLTKEQMLEDQESR
jgi:endonuclease/exonuclease/phosphatase family metal-dependent hydrolase